ncbi:MAG: hypothetical protein ACT4QG_09785 [Sporichthyaceae bacterium]
MRTSWAPYFDERYYSRADLHRRTAYDDSDDLRRFFLGIAEAAVVAAVIAAALLLG